MADNDKEGTGSAPEISTPDINFSAAGTPLFIIGAVVVVLLFMSLKTVPEGNTGVVLEEGKAVGQVGPGWHFVIPVYQDIVTMSHRTETYTMSSSQTSQRIEQSVRAEDALSVKTNEGLNAQMDISVRYRMNKSQAQQVYERLGDTPQVVTKLIRPTVREETRTAASTYSINDIYSQNRSDFRASVQEDIKDDFENFGFEVQKVQVRNIQLPQQVEEAIEAKEAVQQEIGKKQNEIERERLEKQRKIIEAEGEAEQNRILDRSLTQNVLTDRYIKALRSGDVKVAYIPLGENGAPTFVENLNSPANQTAQ
jgi:regulator of protease activity HflC (stomatin/prohibitin superfamily)